MVSLSILLLLLPFPRLLLLNCAVDINTDSWGRHESSGRINRAAVAPSCAKAPEEEKQKLGKNLQIQVPQECGALRSCR